MPAPVFFNHNLTRQESGSFAGGDCTGGGGKPTGGGTGIGGRLGSGGRSTNDCTGGETACCSGELSGGAFRNESGTALSWAGHACTATSKSADSKHSLFI